MRAGRLDLAGLEFQLGDEPFALAAIGRESSQLATHLSQLAHDGATASPPGFERGERSSTASWTAGRRTANCSDWP